MKRILSFAIALMMCVFSFTSCDFGGEQTEQRQAINPTDNFTELVWKINEQVMADYPTVGFYEAFANLAEYDSANYGVIDPTTMVVVYGDTEYPRTVQVTVDTNWIVNYTVVDEPWMEDIYTTPYIPMQLEDALDLIENEIGIVYGAGSIVVLRHQLYYKEAEPRWFIGPLSALHTVNVYTGTVDAELDGVIDHLSMDCHYALPCDTVVFIEDADVVEETTDTVVNVTDSVVE